MAEASILEDNGIANLKGPSVDSNVKYLEVPGGSSKLNPLGLQEHLEELLGEANFKTLRLSENQLQAQELQIARRSAGHYSIRANGPESFGGHRDYTLDFSVSKNSAVTALQKARGYGDLALPPKMAAEILEELVGKAKREPAIVNVAGLSKFSRGGKRGRGNPDHFYRLYNV